MLLGDERDSPRGRIYLIKDMLEEQRPASAEVQTHVDRCLSCLSCMSTCPSGVDYMHLVDLARGYIEETGRRSFKERLTRWMLAHVLPRPDRFRLAIRLAPLVRPWVPLLRARGLQGARRHDRAGARGAAALVALRWPRHRRHRQQSAARA